VSNGKASALISPPESCRLELPDGVLFLGLGDGTGRHYVQADSAFCQTSPRGNLMYAVADGVGSGSEPAYASKYTLSELMRQTAGGVFDKPAGSKDVVQAFSSSLSVIHNKLLEIPQARTTLAGVLERPEGFYVFSIGNSRVYGFKKDGSIEPLTRDDARTQELVDEGTPEPSPKLVDPRDLRIIRMALGDELKEDLIKMIPRGDYAGFLVLTDGITDELRRKSESERFHPRTALLKAFGSDNPAKALMDMVYDKPLNPEEMDNCAVIARRFNPK
jgi:serine/threonine protein phosphatase PrpC